MIVKTEEDLRRHLKQGELCRLYLVCCPDPELKNRCVRGIVKVVCGSADETFNLQRFEGDTVDLRQLAAAVEKVFDLRPSAIIRDLDLRRPIYRQLASYGHMGREDLGVSWEQTNRTEELKKALAE